MSPRDRPSSGGSGTPPGGAGLRLDGIEDDFSTVSRRIDALRTIAPVLRISPTDIEALLPHVKVFRYGDDEVMQSSGDVPASMSFIVKGRVRLVVMGRDGAVIPISTLHQGDFIGQTALTREPVTGNAYAVGEVTVLQIDRDTLEQLGVSQTRVAPGSQSCDRRAAGAREKRRRR